MKIASIIGIILSIAMLITMLLMYPPLLDSSSIKEEYRLLMGLSLLFPAYFLVFSFMTAKKLGYSFEINLDDEE